MLENYNNYGKFVDFVKTGECTVRVTDINIDNWGEYFEGLTAILRDGIETPFVHNTFVKIEFGNGSIIELSITDLWFNLIMWYLIVRVGDKIEPKHLFFDEAITRNSIKKYIDNFFIEGNRKRFSNLELNNIIDDTLCQYAKVDDFSLYLANTINLEDTIKLMDAVPEFNAIMHADLSSVPLEDVKDVGMEMTKKAIYYMKNAKEYIGYDHCLADSWRSMEGINPKQYKEFAVNIGSKPNGSGGVFPSIINTSFIMGGVNTLLSYFIESSTGRVAQILSKQNVGDSGHFARLLGLNNTDNMLHNDPNYDCDTKNYQEFFVTNMDTLLMIRDRYFRLHPLGMEYIVKDTSTTLIGKSIYLRSPMTCASNSRGEGICYKCYGELAYTNADVNIGKIAAEEVSSKLTQILLSAKHLLETKITKIEWTEKTSDIFEVDDNIIKLSPDINFKGWYMIIEQDAIDLENKDDYKKNNYEESDEESTLSESYNEFVTDFQIMNSNREIINISGKDGESEPGKPKLVKLYMSNELNEIIRKFGENIDGKLYIPLRLKGKTEDECVIDCPLFFILIHNNELSKTMDKLMDIIDKNSVTKAMNRHALLQEFVNTIIEGNLDVMSIHCEIILSNQIRHVDNILDKPEWQYPNEPYDVLTLNQALTNNPSIVVSLLYQRLSKLLYNPLSFRKNKPSFLDLFFMEKPQNFLNSTDIKPAVRDTNREVNLINPLIKHARPAEDDDC